MIKAVFDTNIFVSAIIRPEGLPARLLEAALQGRFELFISEQIIEELSAVLAYPRIRDKYRIPSKTAETFVGFIVKSFPNVGRVPELYVVPDDPKDNPVVSTALASEADFLVTGDKLHILSLKDVGSLGIVSAKEFIDLLDKEHQT
jgi:putative PIN family toxin of toxin-antitoxin system